MVRHDAPDVFEGIERANPYSASVRRRFFELAWRLNADSLKSRLYDRRIVITDACPIETR